MPATTSTPRPARRPGRPRLPAGERLSARVTVRLTPAMFAVLAAAGGAVLEEGRGEP